MLMIIFYNLNLARCNKIGMGVVYANHSNWLSRYSTNKTGDISYAYRLR